MDENVKFYETMYKKRLHIVLNTIKNSTVDDMKEVIDAIEKDERLEEDYKSEYIKELAKKIYNIMEDSTNRYDIIEQLENLLYKEI